MRLGKRIEMKKLLYLLLALIFLSGCATVSYTPSDLGKSAHLANYHEVRRGETLWCISRMYDVNLRDIVRSNRIPDASKIEVGQLILIPKKAKETKPVSFSSLDKSESFIWPVKGRVISYFGSTKDMAKNKGIDIKARKESSVRASRSGKVNFISDNLKGYGKTIILDHPGGYQTVYAHNSINLVKENQAVKQGDVIAKVGESGRAKGSALHFEVRKNHNPQNPFYYLP